MKKTAIVYYSEHHGNTRKIVEAIAAAAEEVTLIDAATKIEIDLSGYERIGFASGIYGGQFAKKVLTFAQINLPDKKETFLLYTSAMNGKTYGDDMRRMMEKRNARILGTWHTKGYCTFGPLKVIGGAFKGRPNEEDLKEAVAFYKNLDQQV
ncbi:MAG: flavodoxin [Lachnospiraceae bacterium]|jgi:flavodoxin|nr:flavodoxin [Lachnospiraceae bacterium]